MKNAFKFASAFAFGAALVATPVSFGVDDSLHVAKALADGGGPSANPDTGVKNTGPGADGGGGGPVLLTARTASVPSLAVVGGDTGLPSANPDTGLPSANPDGGVVAPLTSLYN